jgi:hypothetical protein
MIIPWHMHVVSFHVPVHLYNDRPWWVCLTSGGGGGDGEAFWGASGGEAGEAGSVRSARSVRSVSPFITEETQSAKYMTLASLSGSA